MRFITFGEGLAPIIAQCRSRQTDVERDLDILFPIRLKNAIIYHDRISIMYGPDQFDTLMFDQELKYGTIQVSLEDDTLTFLLKQERP